MPSRNFFPHPGSTRWHTLIAAELIVFAALVTYGSTLSAPFIFDDYLSITENSSIHIRQDVAHWLMPPDQLPVGGRPVLNFSFGLNYAISGTKVWSYHVLNLGIHLAAGLALFGIVRRTLLQAGLRPRYGAQATGLALAAALLWIVHPLQTEAVSYIAERAESLMGLFYLLALYCFVRAAEIGAPRLWSCGCVAACLAGVATKEVAVTAPLLIFFYDRTFIAGTFRAAWRQRRRLHLALAGSWILLFFLMRHLSARGVGLALGVSPGTYALTECWAVAHYLRLAFWPHPLIIDYGAAMIARAADVRPQALLLALLLAGAIFAAIRRPPLGFLALSFFLILAPTSSVVPIVHDPIAEHRMYLPLACLIPLAVLALHALGGKAYPWMAGALVLASAFATWQRNETYLTSVGLWREAVAARPANPRAHVNLGCSLLGDDRLPEAQAELQEGIRLNSLQVVALRPGEAELPHDQLGVLLEREDKIEPALAEFHRALQLDPTAAATHCNLAYLLARIGRTAEAIAQYREALRLRPDFPQAQVELAKLRTVR